MNTETVAFLNFLLHSLLIGAAGWLLVRFVIRDALRRAILANLALLMCLYSPFDISFRDLIPAPKTVAVPVWTPLRETIEQDWRVTVAPATPAVVASPVEASTPPVQSWDVNETVLWLRRLSWLVTAFLLLRLLAQSAGVQRWAWRLRTPTAAERGKLPPEFDATRLRVFDHEGTPCAAAWFFPVIAVPASAFDSLTGQQWRWLLRHECEHLRCHDTVAVLLQNLVRAFLWWNPFAHALIEQYTRAREEACDAAAVGAASRDGQPARHPDREAYADFLLAWTVKAGPQPGCVMPIARSRPARRMKARLVALMAARGVRKKLGAGFVLACLGFAVIVPLFAASFGITTAAAQEAPKAVSADDGKLHQRIYRVSPEFYEAMTESLPLVDPFAAAPPRGDVHVPSKPQRRTARMLLEEHGVPFPEGAVAVFNKATMQLIVRNTPANLALVEKAIDHLGTSYPQVFLKAQLLVADKHFGSHGSILSETGQVSLLAEAGRVHGIKTIQMPDLVARQGKLATMEMIREVLGFAGTSDNGDVYEMKPVGPRLFFDCGLSKQGRLPLKVRVEFGLDPGLEDPWSFEEAAKADWNRLVTPSVENQPALASGDWLVLHLTTPVKPVTVLIHAQAVMPDLKIAGSFDALPPPPAASTSTEIPNNGMVEQSYRVPADFAKGKSPIEVLKAAGIEFPEGASAEMQDGKLSVRNTKANMTLVEAWRDNLVIDSRTVRLTVQAVEPGDVLKVVQELLQLPSDAQEEKRVSRSPEAQKSAPDPAADFAHFAGVFTDPQFQTILRRLTQSGSKPEAVPLKNEAGANQRVFELPAMFGGRLLKIQSEIGPDGHTLDLIVQVTGLKSGDHHSISTSITIWDGQTFVLGGLRDEGVMRLLFVTGKIEEFDDANRKE